MARRKRYNSYGASRNNFARVLESLGKDVSDAAKKRLEEGAALVVANAKSRVNVGPTGKGHMPGMLKNAIKWKWKGKKIIISSSDAVNPKGIPYGQYVEFWRKHGFLYPAMDEYREEIKQSVIDAIREAVKKSAKS